MLPSRRRFAQPVPVTTTVMIAVLVALAATFSESNASSMLVRSQFDARLAVGFVLSGRTIATALAHVAEGLEDDWTLSARQSKLKLSGGFGLAAVASNGVDLRPSAATDTLLFTCDQGRPFDTRVATHRRLWNLPPPTTALA